MSRWFRHYAGMMRDEKLVRVAVRAKQPVERVVWVWGAILESAAEINDGGRYEFDAGEAAYFLRCDEADMDGIVGSLESAGRVTDGVVARWGDRQFSSDAAAERQRRYRERKSGGDVSKGDDQHNGDAQRYVTPPSRDAEVTPQETETELDTEKEEQKEPRDARSLEFETFWSRYPNKVGKPKAIASFAKARRAASLDAITAGLERYIANKPPDREWLNPTTFLNQERWNDQPAAPPVRAGPAPRINPTLAATRRLMDKMNADTSSEIEANRAAPRLVAYSVRSG